MGTGKEGHQAVAGNLSSKPQWPWPQIAHQLILYLGHRNEEQMCWHEQMRLAGKDEAQASRRDQDTGAAEIRPQTTEPAHPEAEEAPGNNVTPTIVVTPEPFPQPGPSLLTLLCPLLSRSVLLCWSLASPWKGTKGQTMQGLIAGLA